MPSSVGCGHTHLVTIIKKAYNSIKNCICACVLCIAYFKYSVVKYSMSTKLCSAYSLMTIIFLVWIICVQHLQYAKLSQTTCGTTIRKHLYLKWNQLTFWILNDTFISITSLWPKCEERKENSNSSSSTVTLSWLENISTQA